MVQKITYKSELSENFNQQKEKFLTQRGLKGDPKYALEVYFSDEVLAKEYEVLSYNQVKSWRMIKLENLGSYRWEKKYRLHQYMHTAYCTGVLTSADAMIVDADLSGVKFVRYKDSNKDNLSLPAKQGFVKSVTLGGGVNFERPFSSMVAASYNLNRELNCSRSIRHEFGFIYGFNRKSDSYYPENFNNNVQSSDLLTKEKGFITFNYKLLNSFNMSEYFSSTWNFAPRKNPVYYEFGLNMNLFEVKSYSQLGTVSQYASWPSTTPIETSYSYKENNITVFDLGLYVGLRWEISDVNISLGLANSPYGFFNLTRIKRVVGGATTEYKDNKILPGLFGDGWIPDALLRFSYTL